MTKPPRKCIFCGQHGLTREHMWANWMRAYIPRVLTEYRTRSILMFPDRSEVSIKRRTGDPHSQRIRCVCKNCNNGWMSKIQESTKPYLVPMLKGERDSFYKNGQTALAAWVGMFVMVAEYADRDKVSISARERRRLLQRKRPPAHWRIWIGKYERSTGVERWFHHVIPIAKDGVQIVTNGSIPRSNTQTSTILLGDHLVIHAMSSSVAPGIIKRWRHAPDIASKMRQIWPIQDRYVCWPPDGILDEMDIQNLANRFFESVHAIARRNAGLE